MADLATIEKVLPSVSGDGYIERLNGKISDLMTKLEEGDGAITAEGHGGETGQPAWASTNELKQRLQDLVSVDPGAFDSAVTKLSAAALRLGADQLHDKAVEQVSPDSSAADKVSEYVEKARKTVAGDGTPNDPPWTGDSAVNFEEKFAKYYIGAGETVVDQRWMVNSLQLAMEAHRAVYARVRKDGEDLVDKALEAAGMADDVSPGGSAASKLTTFAAIAGIPAATSGWGVIAAAASAAAATIGAEESGSSEFDLATCCTMDLFHSINSAVGKLEGDVSDGEDEVRSNLDELVGKVSTGQTNKDLSGPFVSDDDGNSPIDYDDDGTASLDDEYEEEFNPPS